ncbi:YfhO family protein [uncultured Clostridium sp.]|uniref:YfhO family protein n=1 Tax=uncultured Clostridium sp. TaxID=59620 RepID=UPI00259A9488|nr:YfhO family protein [uncultured Clostridium sp.]
MKKLKLKLKENYIYIFSFIVPIMLMVVIYALIGIYPVGDKTIVNSDMYLQYVGFLGHIKDVLKGEANLFYSFSKSLGGNTVGLFAYYMSSPLNLIIGLFPKAYIAETIVVITLIKIGLSSLTFTIYLIQSFKKKDINVIMFSLCYSFMAYNINFQLNMMWLDGVVLLPLVILGVDKLINENKCKLYVISLFIAIVSNYYIGYMICIFSGLYFIYKLISNNKVELKKLGIFICASILSVALSAFVLIPTVLSLSSGKAKFRLFQELPKLMMSLDEVIAQLFIGNYSLGQIMGNYPNIYCGVIITVLGILYFLNKNISRKERILSGIFMFVLLLSIFISTLVLIWHGFDYPVGFAYRFSFLISFLGIVLAYKEFISYENISKLKIAIIILLGVGCTGYILYGDYEGLSKWKILLTFLFFVVYIILIKLANWSNFNKDEKWNFSLSVYQWLCKIVKFYRCTEGNVRCVNKPIDYSKCGKVDNNRKKLRDVKKIKLEQIINILIVTIVFIELSINAYSCLKLKSYVSRVRIYNYINEMQPIVDELKENMNNFYRMEEVFANTYDDPMLLNYYGITHSSSANDRNTRKFMANMGFKTSSIFEKYNRGSLISIDSLLGVKYQIASKKSENFSDNHYTENEYYKKVLEEGDYIVYENLFALPIAFMVNDSLKYIDTLDVNAFELNNRILSSMVNTKKAINKSLNVKEIISENLISTINNGEVCYERMDKQKASSITFIVEAEDNNPVYMFLKSNAYESGTVSSNQVRVSINGVRKFTAFDSRNYNVEYIGAFNKGEEIRIEINLNTNKLYLKELQIYSCDVDEFEEVYNKLNENIISDTDYRDGYVKGKISVTEDKTLIYTSIPYDEGWTVKIDGKKVEYVKILDGLIGVDVDTEEFSQGEHVIELKYKVPGLMVGIVISFLALVSCIAYEVFMKVFVYNNNEYRLKN